MRAWRGAEPLRRRTAFGLARGSKIDVQRHFVAKVAVKRRGRINVPSRRAISRSAIVGTPSTRP